MTASSTAPDISIGTGQKRPHLQTNKGTRRDVVTLLLALVFAIAIEAPILVAAHLRPDVGPILALVHIGLIVALGLLTYRAWLRDRAYSMLSILALSTAFFGLLAPVLLLMLLPLFGHFRRRATPFEEWYNSLFPKARLSPSQRLYESILRKEVPGAGAGGVVSFMDVIAKGQTDQKYAIIAMIARNHRPAFTPVLKAALNDPANEIRVQAATAIARLTDDFLKRIQTLEDQLAGAPDDYEVRQKLAQVYDDYAYSGILEPDHKRQAWSKALELWMSVCAAEPENEKALFRVGRLLMRLDKWDLATHWWERIFDEGRATPQSLVWYLECLFRAGRIAELRNLAVHALLQIEADKNIARKTVSAVRTWAENFPSIANPKAGTAMGAAHG